MHESYDADYSDLDEYLAEYVDDAMDPKVREVFEELLVRDPRLAEHVCCLKEARMHLCRLRCHCPSPPEAWQRKLRQVIARENVCGEAIAQAPVVHPRLLATLCSLVLMVAVGISLLDGDSAGPAHETADPPDFVPLVSISAAPDVLIQPLPASIPLPGLSESVPHRQPARRSAPSFEFSYTRMQLLPLTGNTYAADSGHTRNSPLFHAWQP